MLGQCYLLYASTMQEDIPKNIDLHGNADGYALKIQIVLTKNETVAIVTLKKSAQQIKVWLDHKKLKMNTFKTEFILVGAKQQLKNDSQKIYQ